MYSIHAPYSKILDQVNSFSLICVFCIQIDIIAFALSDDAKSRRHGHRDERGTEVPEAAYACLDARRE